MLLFVLAYVGGVLTIASPCILPVLPFVFARADQPFLRRGLPMLLERTPYDASEDSKVDSPHLRDAVWTPEREWVDDGYIVIRLGVALHKTHFDLLRQRRPRPRAQL